MLPASSSILPLLIIQVSCAANIKANEATPLWQKICAVVGLIVVAIASLVYASRRRNIDMRQLLRGYIVPAQAEVTFVNFKSENERGTETVIDTSHTVQKASSFDDDNNYLSKDEELSIDGGSETENRQLSSVFEQKNGSKNKKSKSRKRLANVAKISNNANEEENSQISEDNDL